jgi:hypothetical protein
MDIIEEGRSSEETGKAINAVCSVLIVLEGWAYDGFEDILEKLGS